MLHPWNGLSIIAYDLSNLSDRALRRLLSVIWVGIAFSLVFLNQLDEVAQVPGKNSLLTIHWHKKSGNHFYTPHDLGQTSESLAIYVLNGQYYLNLKDLSHYSQRSNSFWPDRVKFVWLFQIICWF